VDRIPVTRNARVRGIAIAMGSVGVRNIRYCDIRTGRRIQVAICIPFRGF
jgi:hypothetical protein